MAAELPYPGSCCRSSLPSDFAGADVLTPSKGDGEEGEGCAFQNRIYWNLKGGSQPPSIPLLPGAAPLAGFIPPSLAAPNPKHLVLHR